MSRRISVILDDDLDVKLRLRQAKLIHKTKDGVSFSQVLNETLRDGLNGKAKHGT